MSCDTTTVSPKEEIDSNLTVEVCETSQSGDKPNEASNEEDIKADEGQLPVPDFAVVVVQFRRRTQLFLIRFAAAYFGISLNEMLTNAHMITEGDRGYDLGQIISLDKTATKEMMAIREKCTDKDLDLLMTFETSCSLKEACGIATTKKQNNSNSNNNVAQSGTTAERHSVLHPDHILAQCVKYPYIVRNANQEEVDDYHCEQKIEESKALIFAQEQCSRCLSPEVCIIDATFQHDREKLTLWYTAPERVYFVSLLKVLNQRFQCRIWMERVKISGLQRNAANAGVQQQVPQYVPRISSSAPPHQPQYVNGNMVSDTGVYLPQEDSNPHSKKANKGQPPPFYFKNNAVRYPQYQGKYPPAGYTNHHHHHYQGNIINPNNNSYQQYQNGTNMNMNHNNFQQRSYPPVSYNGY
eukprot:Tbor_TRINITY_DN1992_c0_g1::TRINITY_DN1992_c0_g1_i1::g.3562::m.3562